MTTLEFRCGWNAWSLAISEYLAEGLNDCQSVRDLALQYGANTTTKKVIEEVAELVDMDSIISNIHRFIEKQGATQFVIRNVGANPIWIHEYDKNSRYAKIIWEWTDFEPLATRYKTEEEAKKKAEEFLGAIGYRIEPYKD